MRRAALAAAAAFALAGALASGTAVAARVLAESQLYRSGAQPGAQRGGDDQAHLGPRLDDGYVPQGLTFIDGAIYLGTYRSENPNQGHGPCRIYRVDPRTGLVTGVLDLPPQCGHAGGLAKGQRRHLWVADTRTIFEIGLAPRGVRRDRPRPKINRPRRAASRARSRPERPTRSGRHLQRRCRRPALQGAVQAAGTRHRNLERARTPSRRLRCRPRRRGAAFDPAGRLWITRSGRSASFSYWIRTPAPFCCGSPCRPGSRTSASSPAGLWAVSEARSKRWARRGTFVPGQFRLQRICCGGRPRV